MADAPVKAEGLPPRSEYYVETVHFLRRNDGVALIQEIEAGVAQALALTPEALAIPHGDGRRTQFQYDLAWVRTYLKWAGVAENFERGVWTLSAYGASISDEDLRSLWSRVAAEQRRSRVPPPPRQGPGPHFALHNGVLTFAQHVDGRGNDRTRIASIQPVLREVANDLVLALQKHEGLWPALERAAQQYRDLVNKPPASLDFGLLFGRGIVLANAVRAAKADPGGNAYPLATDSLVYAESLLDLHGPFVLGSRDGQALIADAELYEAEGPERQELRDTELELSGALAASNAPTTPEVRSHIGDVLASEDTTIQRDKQRAYRGGLVRNAAIVLAGGAALSTMAAAITIAGPVPAAIAAFAVGVFGKEALKNSKAGKEVGTQLTKMVDAATVDFVNANQSLLRRLAKHRHMNWLNKTLDWSLAQQTVDGGAEAPSGTTPPDERPQILLIEPDQAFSQELKALLRSWGYTADFAARTEKAAMSWAERHPPAIIISETRLGGNQSGIEAAMAVSEKHGGEIVFVANHPDDVGRGRRPRNFVAMAKPIDQNLLRRVVDRTAGRPVDVE
jgi:CheY-like chemotaxis protein